VVFCPPTTEEATPVKTEPRHHSQPRMHVQDAPPNNETSTSTQVNASEETVTRTHTARETSAVATEVVSTPPNTDLHS